MYLIIIHDQKQLYKNKNINHLWLKYLKINIL